MERVLQRFSQELKHRGIEKSTLVKALVPKVAVEAFGKGIPYRLAFRDGSERDAMQTGSLIHGSATKFLPAVANNPAWIAASPSAAVKGGDHALGR